MQREDDLAIFGEEHEIGLPMAGEGPILNSLRTLGNRDAILDMKGGTTAFASSPTALAFAARQVVTPGIVLMACDLTVDKAIDGLGADQLASMLPLDPATGLLGRPTLAQATQNLFAQGGVALQLRAFPATCLGALLGVHRFVA